MNVWEDCKLLYPTWLCYSHGTLHFFWCLPGGRYFVDEQAVDDKYLHWVFCIRGLPAASEYDKTLCCCVWNVIPDFGIVLVFEIWGVAYFLLSDRQEAYGNAPQNDFLVLKYQILSFCFRWDFCNRYFHLVSLIYSARVSFPFAFWPMLNYNASNLQVCHCCHLVLLASHYGQGLKALCYGKQHLFFYRQI